MKKSILFIIAVLILAAVMLSGCAAVNKSGESDTAFVHFTTKTLDGQTADQSIFAQHKVNFVNYWATWCGYCLIEMPELQQLYEEYNGEVGFIGICDDATDSATLQYASEIIEYYGVKYTNLVTFKESEDIFGGEIYYFPSSIVVDNNGKAISEKIEGPYIDDYIEAIDAALAAAQ